MLEGLLGVVVEEVRGVSHEDDVLLVLGQLVFEAGVTPELLMVLALPGVPQLLPADEGLPTWVVFAKGVLAAGVTVAGLGALFVEVEVMVVGVPLADGLGVLQGDCATEGEAVELLFQGLELEQPVSANVVITSPVKAMLGFLPIGRPLSRRTMVSPPRTRRFQRADSTKAGGQ